VACDRSIETPRMSGEWLLVTLHRSKTVQDDRGCRMIRNFIDWYYQLVLPFLSS